MNVRKTALATAVSLSMGISMATIPTTASAVIVNASFTGVFTMVDSAGGAFANTSAPYKYDPTWGYGKRTQISGTMSFNTSTGAGTAIVNPFDFFSSGPAVPHDIVMQAIGNGVGGPGTLVAGAMLFDWNGNVNIDVGIILDAAGFFGALQGGAMVSDSISGVGALPASNAVAKAGLIGPAPMATTFFNTDYNVNAGCAMTATCLTSTDTIGGDPMDNGPFPGNSANFDITNVHIDSFGAAVPVPAAVWLFGSGLLGLVGVARRRKQS